MIFCIVLAYLMQFAALFNDACAILVYFAPDFYIVIIYTNALCFRALSFGLLTYCLLNLLLLLLLLILLLLLLGCQGCQGGVVPLTGEHVVLLGVVRPLWSPPDTQLSPVAPRSCLHATAATPRATASTGRQNLVRVADAFITIGDLGLVYLCM